MFRSSISRMMLILLIAFVATANFGIQIPTVFAQENVIWIQPGTGPLQVIPPCVESTSHALLFQRTVLGDIRYLGYDATGSQVVTVNVTAPGGTYTPGYVSSMFHKQVQRLEMHVTGVNHQSAASCLYNNGSPYGASVFEMPNETASPIAVRTWWIIDWETGFGYSCTEPGALCQYPVVWIQPSTTETLVMPTTNLYGDRPILAVEDEQYENDLTNGIEVPPPWDW